MKIFAVIALCCVPFTTSATELIATLAQQPTVVYGEHCDDAQRSEPFFISITGDAREGESDHPRMILNFTPREQGFRMRRTVDWNNVTGRGEGWEWEDKVPSDFAKAGRVWFTYEYPGLYRNEIIVWINRKCTLTVTFIQEIREVDVPILTPD